MAHLLRRDGTGHAMLTAIADRAIAESIPVHERTEALALIHEGGRCYGAVVRDLITGELRAYVAKATAIATGGAGRIYRNTTNAVISEGIGNVIAMETGQAALGNMEAVQFHPTAIFPAGILVTEGCRGDGGLLKDVDGHRFMPDYEPEKKELARATSYRGAWKSTSKRARRRSLAFRRAPLARHHAAGRAPHQTQPARGVGDLPLLPRRRPGARDDPGAPGAALHDGRRAYEAHRPEPDVEGPLRCGRGGVLGHARLQPAGGQLGGRDSCRRHDRRVNTSRTSAPARRAT